MATDKEIAATILTALFAVQRWGTHKVGSFFGPVMVAWFLALALSGVAQLVTHPGIVTGLSPTYAATFAVSHPFIAFIAIRITRARRGGTPRSMRKACSRRPGCARSARHSFP